MRNYLALRALGDRDNPDHWDTWTSPSFELDARPGPEGASGSEPGKGKAALADD